MKHYGTLLKNTGVPERMLDDYEEKVERFVGKFCLQKESLKILVTSEEKKQILLDNAQNWGKGINISGHWTLGIPVHIDICNPKHLGKQFFDANEMLVSAI